MRAALLVPLLALPLLLGCKSEAPGARGVATGSTSPPPAAEPKSSTSAPSKEVESSSAPAKATTPAPRPEPEAAAKKRYVVAALGDSITDARSGGGGFLRHLSESCPDSRFDNFGKGGDMTNQMRRRFEQEILPSVNAKGYTTLLVYGGVNDLYSNLTAGRTNERIESDLEKIYAGARQAGLEVIALTVSPWGGFTRYFNPERSMNTRLLNSWILGGVAAGRVDKAADTYPLLSCGDPEMLCRDYETRHHDGLHPGDKGHALLGQLLLEKAFSDCR